jgi:dienelactone hydrolase
MNVAQQIVDDGNGHNVPLRLYVERIFDEREQALALAFDAQQRLFEKYEAELEVLKNFRARAVGFSALLALVASGVPHEIVTYEGAPHSFFDPRFANHATASQDAWARVLAFIRQEPSRPSA